MNPDTQSNVLEMNPNHFNANLNGENVQPTMNFEDIYKVLLASQTMALENYRLHLAAANSEREDRKKMVERYSSKDQITLTEQEYLIRAIAARNVLDEIGVALKNVAMSEEKFTFGISKISTGHVEEAQKEFDYSSQAMQAAAERMELMSRYTKKNPFMAKTAFLLKEKLSQSPNSKSEHYENAYEFGYVFGAQMKSFSQSMKSFASKIKNTPTKIMELVKDKKMTFLAATTNYAKTFYSESSFFFNKKKDMVAEKFSAAADTVKAKKESLDNNIFELFDKCYEYSEAMDDFAAEKKQSIAKHSAGTLNVVTGLSIDAKNAAKPLFSKLQASIVSSIVRAQTRVKELYAQGVENSQVQAQAPKRIAPSF